MIDINKINLEISGFISHHSIESWGNIIYLMERDGRAFAKIYWFNDEDAVYLSDLNVDINVRRQGIGTKLQKIREDIGKQIGATEARLWVKIDTWMHDWYLRRGYTDFEINEKEDNAIWMEKRLI